MSSIPEDDIDQLMAQFVKDAQLIEEYVANISSLSNRLIAEVKANKSESQCSMEASQHLKYNAETMLNCIMSLTTSKDVNLGEKLLVDNLGNDELVLKNLFNLVGLKYLKLIHNI